MLCQNWLLNKFDKLLSMAGLEGKDISHVIAGYKAAMHNPNISAEGKHHAAQELRRLEKQQHHETQPVDFPDLKGKNIENAAIHNPNVSDEAKEHAKLMVFELEEYQKQPHYSPHDYPEPDLQGKDIHNVLRGYKAAAHNPHVSDEARMHALEMIQVLERKLQPEEEEMVNLEGKNPGRVLGGYKARAHAQHMVDVLEHQQGK